MSIRYSRILGIGALVLGLINLGLGGWLFLLGQFSFSLIFGVMMLLFSGLYFTRPYFWIAQDAVVMPALIGPVKRTWYFGGDPARIKMENGRLMVYDGYQWKPVPVRRWLSEAGDWQMLEQHFMQRM